MFIAIKDRVVYEAVVTSVVAKIVAFTICHELHQTYGWIRYLSGLSGRAT